MKNERLENIPHPALCSPHRSDRHQLLLLFRGQLIHLFAPLVGQVLKLLFQLLLSSSVISLFFDLFF